MSATAPAPARELLGRHRRTILVVLAVVVVLVGLSVLHRDHARFGGDLDPRNPGPAGAQALAEVLAGHGVDVSIVRGQAALLAQQVDADTAIVVTDPDALGPSTLRRLEQQATRAGSLVLVGPATVLGAELSLPIGELPVGTHRAACAESLASGLQLRSHGGDGLRAAGCFGEGDASALVRRDRTWLFASPASLANEHVLESGNAAVGLRLLGQQSRLLWYVADTADLAPDEGVGLAGLLPTWLGPAGILLAIAVLALVLWRGRRLGPLVVEPLPVVVRAAESTQSRGRLYRRTGDRVHAARILAESTRGRLVGLLGLAPGSSVEAVVAATAARTGRDPREVHALLAPPEPATVPTHARLADLGRRLLELENEVRHR